MSNLLVFVEGKDDFRFINFVLIDFFNLNNSIMLKAIPYKNKERINTVKLIKQIKETKSGDYIFLSDLDSHTYKCITSRKNSRIKEFHNPEYDDLDFEKIFIVVEEIESWYVAGIDTSLKQFKNLDIPDNTDTFTKEQFDDLLSNSTFSSKIDFFMEIVTNYNLSLAIQRNQSFKYFLQKLDMLKYI